jgi:hypothetical protein
MTALSRERVEEELRRRLLATETRLIERLGFGECAQLEYCSPKMAQAWAHDPRCPIALKGPRP